MSDELEVNPCAWFAAQQWKEHEWATNVHLSPDLAAEASEYLAAKFRFRPPALIWEAQDAIDGEAVTICSDRSGRHTVYFTGWGCTLLTLCHELVHVMRPWDQPFHDDVDWDLCTILLEECLEP